jgi:hypothetical protein
MALLTPAWQAAKASAIAGSDRRRAVLKAQLRGDF